MNDMQEHAIITRQGIVTVDPMDPYLPRNGEDALSTLHLSVGIAQNLKLMDVMDIVGSNPHLAAWVRTACWCPNLKDIHKEAKDCPPDTTGLTNLLVEWHTIKQNPLLVSPRLIGYGPEESRNLKIGQADDEGNAWWDVGLTPLNQIAGLYIKTDNRMHIAHAPPTVPGQTSAHVFMLVHKPFTVAEFLHGIYATIGEVPMENKVPLQGA